MADTDNSDTTTDEPIAGTEENPPGGTTLAPEGDAPVADGSEEAVTDPDTAEDETEDAEDTAGDGATEEPAAEAAEPAFSPFGAQFSSPEPTAVIARPRRRATRPAAAADPGTAQEAAAPLSPPVPAFVSFVAPPEEAAPQPRRRARRAEPADDTAAETADEEQPAEAPRPRRSRSRRKDVAEVEEPQEAAETTDETAEDTEAGADEDRDEDREEGTPSGSRRRRRGRRGRGRGRSGDETGENADESADETSDEDEDAGEESASADDGEGDESEGGSSTRRRRRRRRRSGEDRSEDGDDDRGGRLTSDDDVRGISGSTRLEAKRQRRRDGRDTGRRRAPILTEAEFLARREAVERAMVIRQRGDRTQIAVLEDDVLVEHYVTQAQNTSFAGNVYLGRVQNVLPSMEAAFVDIGKGRNAVLYAGEVNWDAAGLTGKQRSIEQALKSGDKVVVQVTKDPIGHKGARLTQQVNLPGRFLVYVPGGSMTGISRKLPDTERQRLKDILKKIVPEDAGVIIRTAAEGASEEELTRDVARLQAQWEVIQTKSQSATNAPTLLYGEPDLAIRVIRDVFNEDFKELVVQGDDAWDTVEAYVAHVSPELSGRLSRYAGTGDVFADKRIDEQLAKALDRKVWLPSGGSLVIDRTEAMTVIDVNTGKFTGSGGNLESTVTRNNMEAAEEIVRQLRLRDIGGIIVIDFIDMVLESNRDLVLRRLTECLGRDRTKHQVAEVTSLGLVQMTRKRVGQGLLEVFSEPCECCRGRGLIVHLDPVDERRRGGGNHGHNHGAQQGGNGRKDGGKERAEKATKDEPEAAEVTAEVTEDAEATESGRSGSRRSRGRRNRGQSGEERATEDRATEDTATEDTAVLEDGRGEQPPAEVGTEGHEVPAAVDTAEAEHVAEEPQADVVVDTAEAVVTARPRRRRAASRPAGPPTA